MGHQRRVDGEGAWHHVMNRVSGRRVVFRSDRDRACFIDLLAEVDDRFGLEVHCYCLMGNHFHLLVRSERAELSAAIQWLAGNFTRRINAARGVDGPIFRGRFKSVSVTEPAHLAYLVRYIESNPLGLGWSEPLVDYPWSSLGCHAGVRSSPRWLHRDVVCGLFERGPSQLVDFVETALVCGDVSVPKRTDIEAVVGALELARRIDEPEVSERTTKSAAILLLIDGLGLDRSLVAGWAGIGESALRSSLARARDRMKSDDAYRAMVVRSSDIVGVDGGRAAVGV
jgi:REP element-mobilizing transposase RayT